MGSLEDDSEAVSSDVYSVLGLNGSLREISETPRVLSLLSSHLERSIQKNEKILEMSKRKEVITVFHGSRAPNLSIRQYIDRIFKYSNCSPSCFVLAYIYMDRFLQQPDVHLTSLNVHRLLITSMMLAAKFIDDAFFNNAYYAKVGGVGTAEMNRLELNFLFSVDFRLHVSLRTFGSYCLQLERESSGGAHQIERSIQVCGLKGWPNKEESKCPQPTIQRFSCRAV